MIFDIFLIFAQNIDCGYTLEPPRLCFGAKIRKIGIHWIPQFCYIKVGYEGVCITRTCFPEVLSILKDDKGLERLENCILFTAFHFQDC